MTTKTWTVRMTEALTEAAEYYWKRMHAATNGAAKAHHEKAYNRRMAAVAYLRTRG